MTTVAPVTVLALPGKSAEACVGGVRTSLPPQCGGPVLRGFDWADHAGDFEESGGIRWGEFVVTGRFDGTAIDVTEIVPADEWVRPKPSPHPDLFKTPCAEPAGGWNVVDASKASGNDQGNAFESAAKLPGYADAFIDNSSKPAVVNIRVTGDPAVAEKAIREVWGGPLCVSKGKYTEKEMRQVQAQVSRLPGMFSSGAEDQVMQVYVTYDDGTLQAWADSQYDPGLVRVTSALVPVG